MGNHGPLTGTCSNCQSVLVAYTSHHLANITQILNATFCSFSGYWQWTAHRKAALSLPSCIEKGHGPWGTFPGSKSVHQLPFNAGWVTGRVSSLHKPAPIILTGALFVGPGTVRNNTSLNKVLWAGFPTHYPLDTLHLFLVEFLCTRVFQRAFAATVHSYWLRLASGAPHLSSVL